MATSSIYHFFIELAKRRGYLTYSANLEDFEFPESMVAAKSKGSFPDLVLRLSDQQPFSGGELIEIKTSQSYGISSFNSTLPRSSHKVSELSKNIRDQMLNKGEDPDAVPEREIYYLIFGINKRARPAPLYKICLVHGAFFETISTESAIKQAFQEMLEECGITVDQFIWEEATINQNTINRSRHPTDSSFRIRFRMMAEAHKNANLLNSNLYPAITDNSLSLVLPFENEKSEFPKDSQSSLEYVKLWDVADSIRSNKRFKSIQIAFNEQDTEIMDSTSIGVLRSQISGYFLHVRVDSPTTKSI